MIGPTDLLHPYPAPHFKTLLIQYKPTKYIFFKLF